VTNGYGATTVDCVGFRAAHTSFYSDALDQVVAKASRKLTGLECISAIFRLHSTP